MKLLKETSVQKYGKRGYMFAVFLCECGKEFEMAKHRGLVTETCQECCRKLHKQKVTKHGDRYTRLYRTWINMNKRCNDASYKTYNGKGITVCDDWKSYDKFKEWALKHGYTELMTIDRINSDGNYEPNNCQWISNRYNAGKDKCHISIENVIKIRQLFNTGGYTQKQLAIDFDTDYRIINRIVRNKSYDSEYYS